MTGKTTTFGDYVADERVGALISTIEIRILPKDFNTEWQRCGQTADYLASYLAHHFEDFEMAMNVLSTVLNELIENSVKFSASQHEWVSISASFSGKAVILEATNSATAEQLELFTAFVERLLSEDVEDLFLARIEDSDFGVESGSGLGLITIKKDYLSGIGVRFQQRPISDLYDVSVQLHLDADLVTQG